MEIVFVSPEVVPFSKVGEVADVTGSLPKALRALGHKVTVVSALYGTIDPNTNALARRLAKLPVRVGDEILGAEVYEAKLASGVNVTLLNGPGLTDRPRVYGEPDDPQRFAFLCRAAIEWMRAQPRMPDVVHAHDWAAGLVPLYLREAAAGDPRLASVASVFTLHDGDQTGPFDAADAGALGLRSELLDAPGARDPDGRPSFARAGLRFANKVTTVSPTYARELTQAGATHPLADALRARGRDFVGILNGIDFSVWNPGTDPHLIARYDAEDVRAKERCKADLLTSLELQGRPGTPLLIWVGPLDARRGADLLLHAAARVMRQDLQLVILGDGPADVTADVEHLARSFPDRVRFQRGYDDALAHRLYGAADFFLAPSRGEPSGLAHLYAMRYGAVPVVRATGALRDTVVDCDAALQTGTGFVFEGADPEEFFGALARALAAYPRQEPMARLRHRVMRRDFSWDRSARHYQGLYAGLAAPTPQPSPAT